jgi:aspartyl protease family protein
VRGYEVTESNLGLTMPKVTRGMSLTIKYAAFWLLLAGVAYLAFDAFLSPNVARAVATDGTGVVIIERSRDQHFYVQGAINGRPVTFLVDTGATIVSVNEEMAKRLGLPHGVTAVFDTAAGRSVGRVVSEATVQVGSIKVDGIRVGINSGGPAALLGQNFLSKVDLRQDAARMTLRVLAP